MPNDEKLVNANGVELCVETFGNIQDPVILLVHGASASMLWWEAELCEKIAAGGRFVIRFDSRDTGRSVHYPAGQPGYSLRDMTEDALGVLDVLGIQRAHLVGRSMAGAIISLAGIDYPDRVASLTFVSTTPGGGGLPPMSDEFMEYTSRNPDPADSDEVVEFITGLMKVYSGGSRYYDEKAMRTIAEADVARADNVASTLTNHFVINFDGPDNGGLGDISAPTLVVHGEKDPVFPLPHGEALRGQIPGAELLIMEKTGDELPEPLWDVFAAALIKHTAG